MDRVVTGELESCLVMESDDYGLFFWDMGEVGFFVVEDEGHGAGGYGLVVNLGAVTGGYPVGYVGDREHILVKDVTAGFVFVHDALGGLVFGNLGRDVGDGVADSDLVGRWFVFGWVASRRGLRRLRRLRGLGR